MAGEPAVGSPSARSMMIIERSQVPSAFVRHSGCSRSRSSGRHWGGGPAEDSYTRTSKQASASSLIPLSCTNLSEFVKPEGPRPLDTAG